MCVRSSLPLVLLAAMAFLSGCAQDAPATDSGPAVATKPGSGSLPGIKDGGASAFSDPKPVVDGATTPAFTSPQDLAKKAGVDLYPGARTPNNKSSITDDERETHYTLIMSTPDKPDKVLAFYAKKIQNADANSKRVMGFGANGSSVIVTATPKDGSTEVKVVTVVEKGAPGG